MLRSPVLSRISTFLLLTLLFLIPCSKSLDAQSDPTASKEAAISLFATYSRVSTDRNSTINNGLTVGADYTRYLNWILTPSLEVRCKFAPGDNVGEDTFGGGLRVEHRLKNFSPYADFFGSYGRITFTHPSLLGPGPPYRFDNSIVYSAGFGVDYHITSKWAARVDYQFEHWNVGMNSTFTPHIFSVGFLYRIPFRPYVTY
jgi:opacity protein-like surface antigen